jgi:hypothetical protein
MGWPTLKVQGRLGQLRWIPALGKFGLLGCVSAAESARGILQDSTMNLKFEAVSFSLAPSCPEHTALSESLKVIKTSVFSSANGEPRH